MCMSVHIYILIFEDSVFKDIDSLAILFWCDMKAFSNSEKVIIPFYITAERLRLSSAMIHVGRNWPSASQSPYLTRWPDLLGYFIPVCAGAAFWWAPSPVLPHTKDLY